MTTPSREDIEAAVVASMDQAAQIIGDGDLNSSTTRYDLQVRIATALRLAASQMSEREKAVADLAHWLPAAVAAAMSEAWNTICSESNALPDDLIQPKVRGQNYLGFEPGEWARLTASVLAFRVERGEPFQGDHDDGKPVSPWRPMDEAPRDGSEFQALATVDANGAWIWEPRCRFEPKNEVFEIWGRVDYDQDGWEVHPLITLQSWQPQPVLPPPPTGSGE